MVDTVFPLIKNGLASFVAEIGQRDVEEDVVKRPAIDRTVLWMDAYDEPVGLIVRQSPFVDQGRPSGGVVACAERSRIIWPACARASGSPRLGRGADAMRVMERALA